MHSQLTRDPDDMQVCHAEARGTALPANRERRPDSGPHAERCPDGALSFCAAGWLTTHTGAP
jgi:hypothetical protein